MITGQQREERSRFIGSSDIAALFTDSDGKSLDPFKGPLDVWASKVFDFEKQKETTAITSGVRWEPYILEWAENELKQNIVKASEHLRFICQEHPIFASNLDGFIPGENPVIVEAKKSRFAGEWGEPGTDEVPYRVNLQVHLQMLCTGWNSAWIAAMILGEEILFKVNRDERIINAIIRKGENFWEKYVLTKTPPPDAEQGDLNLFKRIKRVPEKYADCDDNLFFDWEAARQDRLDAEKAEETAFKKILVALGDAEGVKLSDGREFTYFSQKGADTICRNAFKTLYPEVYAAVASPSQHRVARITKGKK